MNDAERIERAKRWAVARKIMLVQANNKTLYFDNLPRILNRVVQPDDFAHYKEDSIYLALDAAIESCKAAVGLDEDTIERCAAVADKQDLDHLPDWAARVALVHLKEVAAAIRKLKGTSHADQ